MERTPAITGVYTTGSAPEAAPSELDIGTPYLITGRFFGQATSKPTQKIAFSGKPTGVPITVSDWGPSEIVFTVGGTSGLTTISTIEVTLPDGKTILNTPAGFTVKKPS
ncbi:MAG: hypothetical protein ACR2OJ_09265 [Hyphomicrobiales bacterium]